MELKFEAMLCSNLGNENAYVGHTKRSCGPQVPNPCFKACTSPIWASAMFGLNLPVDGARELFKPSKDSESSSFD